MSEMPKAVLTSKLQIGSAELVVHVLDNGERVVDADSFEGFLEYLADGGPMTQEDAEKIAQLMRTVQ